MYNTPLWKGFTKRHNRDIDLIFKLQHAQFMCREYKYTSLL